jgi:hypothetical protein
MVAESAYGLRHVHLSVCLSLCMYQPAAPIGSISLKFDVSNFNENLPRNSDLTLKYDKNFCFIFAGE